MPANVNDAAWVARIRDLAPDFLFSFYYRQMLGAPLLALPRHGALNMHGSLLPRYRGRAPVNWAVLHGERETGATLHHMAEKPDAGDMVAQTAVPILPDDTAREVFDKVTVAAELTLDRVLPALLAGTAPRVPLDLAAGSYFGGRTAEDGRIDWMQPAAAIHNLVRAVAPPYPGATTLVGGRPARILRTRVLDAAAPAGAAAAAGGRRPPRRAVRRRRHAARARARDRRPRRGAFRLRHGGRRSRGDARQSRVNGAPGGGTAAGCVARSIEQEPPRGADRPPSRSPRRCSSSARCRPRGTRGAVHGGLRERAPCPEVRSGAPG